MRVFGKWENFRGTCKIKGGILCIRKYVGVLTAAMVTGLTACGSKAAEETTAKAAEGTDGEVTIHLMMSNSQELGVSAAVEAFNKAYEGKIRCEADYVAFNDVFETLEVLMSNKSTEYDIFAADGPKC